MSLINRMLQDLETRRADESERAALSGEVRPLPAEPPSPWVRIALGVVVAGLLAAGGVLWLRNREAALPTPPRAPQAQSAPIAAAPAEAPHAASAQTAPAAQLAAPPQPAPTPAAPLASAQEPAVALAESKAPPAPQPAPEAKPKHAPPRPEPARPSREGRLKVATTLSLPGDVTATRQAPRSGEGPASIDKQIRTPSAHDRAESEYRKAVGQMNQGRLNEAMAAMRAALHEDPAHVNARLTLLGILIEQKKLDEAQALAEEGLAPNPAQPQLAMRLARIQVERGDARGAAETLRKAAGTAAGNAEFRGFHAAVLQRLTLHKEAAEEYQAALKLAPQVGVWWMGLGISLEAEGRTADAREAYQRSKSTGSLTADLNGFVEAKLRQLQ